MMHHDAQRLKPQKVRGVRSGADACGGGAGGEPFSARLATDARPGRRDAQQRVRRLDGQLGGNQLLGGCAVHVPTSSGLGARWRLRCLNAGGRLRDELRVQMRPRR